MPQKVRISAGYADKASENYNSRQFSINLEMDITVNGSTKEIEDASAKLFQLCRKIVDAQRGISVDGLLNNESLPPASIPPLPSTGNGKTRSATKKQIDYLLKLGKKAKLTVEQINALPAQYYNKPDFQSLTSSEASNLIDTLSAKKAA